MVGMKKTEERETAEQDSLMLARNLLRIALYNISYIRELFPINCFTDVSVPEIGMNIKKLIPMNSDSRRLIDWMEKGVSDALQKKYLKTLLFYISEKDEGNIIEEYAFSFKYPNLNLNDVEMNLSLTGSKKTGGTFKSNAAEATPDRMRSSACKMIRTVVSLMSNLDQLPDKRTIQMKLIYYEDVTPEDYEAPLFKPCDDDIVNRKPFQMEVGSANSKHLILAQNINTHLDPYIICNDNTEDGCAILGTDCKKIEILSFSEENLVKRFELCCISKRGPLFHLDSGASFHICNDKTYMQNMRSIPPEKRIELRTADGQTLIPEEMGTIRFQNINLSQVMYIPLLQFNVISVGQLDKQGLLISVGGGQFLIIDVQNSIIIGEGYKDTKRNDYIFRGINWVKPDPEDKSELSIFKDIDPAATHCEKESDLDEPSDKEHSVKDEDYDSWIIDSCSAIHLTGRKDLLTNIRHCQKNFHGPKSVISCTQMGDVKTVNLHLLKVMYSSVTSKNLLSVAILDSEGYRFIFYGGKCGIVCKGTLQECGSGTRDDTNNLYYLHEFIPEKGVPNTKRKR